MDAVMKSSHHAAPNGAATRASARANVGGQATSEMAHCVKGVLARIEEALTKLDRPTEDDGVQGKENYAGGVTDRAVPSRAPESWESGGRAGRASAGGAVSGRSG